jgi:hypothetical protein
MVLLHNVEVTALGSGTMIRFVALDRVVFVGLCASCGKEVTASVTFTSKQSEEDRAVLLSAAGMPFTTGVICNACGDLG